MAQKQRLLLLEDVEALGRSGQVVEVKKGFARNFLIPRSKATIASKHTLRMQVSLQQERAKMAVADRIESEALSKIIEAKKVVSIEVKVDPEGKLYGSVTSKDISSLFAEDNIDLDRKYIMLDKPIKDTGTFVIPIHLKEDVNTEITLQVIPEGGALLAAKKEPVVEKSSEENFDQTPSE